MKAITLYFNKKEINKTLKEEFLYNELGDGEIKLRIIISVIIVLELRKTWMPTLYYNVYKEIDQESQNIRHQNKE